MVLAKLFGSALLAAMTSGSCGPDETCVVGAPALGASQLQLKSSATGARGRVSEGDAEAATSGLAEAMGSYLAQGAKLHAAAKTVQEAAARMNASYSPSVDQLSNLINGFNNHVSGSYDGCSTQLYELRQQLEVIHQQVYQLTVEVNSTEYGIYTYEEACREKTTQISVIEQTRRTHRQHCVTEKQSVRRTLELLKVDLIQMKQIASTHVRVLSVGGSSGGGAYSGGSYTSGGATTGGSIGYGAGVGIGGGYTGGITGGITGGMTAGYTGGISGGSMGYSGGSAGYGTGGVGYGTGYSVGGGGMGVTGSTSSSYSSSQSITNPGLTGGSVNIHHPYVGVTGHPFAAGYGLLETDAKVEPASQAPEQPQPAATHAQPEATPEDRAARAASVQNMVQEAKDVAQRASECMAKPQGQSQEAEVFLEIGHEQNETGQPYTNPSVTYPGSGSGSFYSESPQCREIILQLTHTFTSAYVSLTRLIEEYEMVVISTVCEDTVDEEYSKDITVVQTEASQVCHRVQVFIQHLNQFKLQLTQAVTTEHNIEASLAVLTQQCGSLTQTSNYLSQVSSTLLALGSCPGLNGTSFSLPTWVGAWVYVMQELQQTDAEFDAAMLQACKTAYPNYGYTVRSAEVAEIDQQSVQGLPTTNTARSPLIGACPMCEGDAIGDSHGRVCWDAVATLNAASRRGDCRMGERAVACVYEPTIAYGGSGYSGGAGSYSGSYGTGAGFGSYGSGYTGSFGMTGGLSHGSTGYGVTGYGAGYR